jgi:hypothetical protein
MRPTSFLFLLTSAVLATPNPPLANRDAAISLQPRQDCPVLKQLNSCLGSSGGEENYTPEYLARAIVCLSLFAVSVSLLYYLF